MIYRFTFLLPLLAVLHTQAQPVNLVPNGSFEERTECIYNDSNVLDAPPWFNPTMATPDVFHECAIANVDPCPFPQQAYLDPWLFGIPTNFLGCQSSFSGSGYAGFFAYSLNVFPFLEEGWREYLGVKLTSPLIANENYTLKFQVSLAERMGYAVSNLQVLFRPDSIFFDQDTPIVLDAQLSSENGNYLSNYNEWMEVSWNFTADGTETFMYIGNFQLQQDVDKLYVFPHDPEDNYTCCSYYYIDDVILFQNDPVGIHEADEFAATLFPNPTNGLVSVRSLQSIEQVSIYSQLGALIRNQAIGNLQNFDVQISDLSAGLYVLVLYGENGSEARKKIVKQ